jgi:transposase
MIEQCFGGIDVSQDRLDVLLLPQATRFSVANDEAGWNALSARLSGLPLAAIGLEPSGGYERGVIRALLSAGLSVRRINPNRLRQFARARGALAKNDRLDARLIAEYVATMPTRVVRHDPAAARIAEIVTVRRLASCGDTAASMADACRSETSSTWLPSAPAVATPPSKHSTSASPLPARSPRS